MNEQNNGHGNGGGDEESCLFTFSMSSSETSTLEKGIVDIGMMAARAA